MGGTVLFYNSTRKKKAQKGENMKTVEKERVTPGGRKFELFGGCLGNGTTVCNKAVEENGDYKIIAHISNSGKIVWYIKDPEKYVPAEDMEKIHEWADAARNKFLESWKKLPDLRKYEVILNEIGYLPLLNHPLKEQLKACTDLHKKVELLEKIYFEREGVK